MKIRILLPGKIKPKALAPAQEEYIRRLGGFGVDVAEYKDEKVSSRSPEQTKEAEAQRILKLLK
ncbi:MAG: 23S rRNA (pseudouridine(1915)-N(3))-methyltransferase RlmH, partial [Pontiella sp.]|nr:23S rRNA (pseudouridine(1915)-N(3))-methyltransferase RlmH [Pontiella sp.]